jgi:hypothetical protein
MGVLCTSFTPKVALFPGRMQAGYFLHGYISPEILWADAVYDEMNLASLGLSHNAFLYAVKGYQQLVLDNRVERHGILSICDLSQSSAKKRLYILDLSERKVLAHTYVAHGRNSGGEFATEFSNTPESLQSSLGFFVTGQTYTGKHGLSLRMHGVDGKFNNKAFERTIVIHGADYVDANRVKSGGYMGRSWGCPAVSRKEATSIISMIRDGSCYFIYYPSSYYLEGSKILND